MLNKLILENYKSFKNRTIIDLNKTNYTILPQNVSESGILKGAIFVGANGSGKSNVLSSIRLLLGLLFKEKEIDMSMDLCLLSEEKEYSLEYQFNIDGSDIIYEFKKDTINKMIYEKLMLDDKCILDRKGLTAKVFINDEEKIFNDNHINPNSLFLRTLYFNDQFSYSNTIQKWFDFLKNSVYINASSSLIENYNNIKSVMQYLDENGTEEINNFLEKYGYDQRIEYKDNVEGENYQILSSKKKIFYRRQGINLAIPREYESHGNRILVAVLSVYLPIIRNGGLLLIDEFSSGFHNALEKLLIKHFMKESVNTQILFVSHSTNLLSNSILRPDQEFSVEFVGNEGSKITRFSSMQPRNSQNIEKMYNSGVFNGIPDYGELDEDK